MAKKKYPSFYSPTILKPYDIIYDLLGLLQGGSDSGWHIQCSAKPLPVTATVSSYVSHNCN